MEIEYFVGGAMARIVILEHVFGGPPGRATLDVDIGDPMTHDPAFQRKDLTGENLALRDEATRWMMELPAHVRPVELGRRFPRIINTIAAKWFDVIGCRHYLNSLQFDDRGGRYGFSFDILQEIDVLRQHFDAVYPPDPDIWQNAFDAEKR